MTGINSYFGDPKRKKKYVDLMQSHIDADTLIKGKYWEDGKGCHIGCLFQG